MTNKVDLLSQTEIVLPKSIYEMKREIINKLACIALLSCMCFLPSCQSYHKDTLGYSWEITTSDKGKAVTLWYINGDPIGEDKTGFDKLADRMSNLPNGAMLICWRPVKRLGPSSPAVGGPLTHAYQMEKAKELIMDKKLVLKREDKFYIGKWAVIMSFRR